MYGHYSSLTSLLINQPPSITVITILKHEINFNLIHPYLVC